MHACAVRAPRVLSVWASVAISGEPGVGKSRLALDILKQLGNGRPLPPQPLVSVLALVGRRQASVAAAVKALADSGRLHNTVVVASLGAWHC